MKYNKGWAINQYHKKEPLKFIFFWGHQSSTDGDITKTCFSQWWPATFVAGDQAFATAEHWMMYRKATLFKDEIIAEKILQANVPAEVKKLGRQIQNFDAATWDKHKFEIVAEGNFYKFSQNNELKSFLLSTGDSIIVEASPVDAIWGIGMASGEAGIYNPNNWKGENLLGFALMEVRDRLLNV